MKMGSAHHPYVIERIDGLLLANHRRQGVVIDLLYRLITARDAPHALKGPDFCPLDTSAFAEVVELFDMEQEAKQKAIAALKRGRR